MGDHQDLVTEIFIMAMSLVASLKAAYVDENMFLMFFWAVLCIGSVWLAFRTAQRLDRED